MAEPQVCLPCGREISGRRVQLNPPDPRYALCLDCNATQRDSTPPRDAPSDGSKSVHNGGHISAVDQ
jgi:hypothetical protein